MNNQKLAGPSGQARRHSQYLRALRECRSIDVFLGLFLVKKNFGEKNIIDEKKFFGSKNINSAETLMSPKHKPCQRATFPEGP